MINLYTKYNGAATLPTDNTFYDAFIKGDDAFELAVTRAARGDQSTMNYLRKHIREALEACCRAKVRLPELEKEFATIKMGSRDYKYPYIIYEYAMYCIKARWLEKEAYIATTAAISGKYAINIMKARWPEAEADLRRVKKEGIYPSTEDVERYERAFGVYL